MKRTSKKVKKHAKAPETPSGEGYVDPVEAVRERVERAVSIGSPLLYPF